MKNTNAQVLLFFLQSTRYVSNEQPCLKITGLCEDLLLFSSLFHFFYFIFSRPTSFSLCFPISPSLIFLYIFFLKPFSSIVEKCGYMYTKIICTIYIYIRKLMNFCQTKKFMTFLFHLFDLV